MTAREPVAHSASSVARTTDRAGHRGVGGIFPRQPNPAFLTRPSQQVCDCGVKPMRQPSVERPRKLSPRVAPNPLQVLNTKDPNSAQINPLEFAPQERLDLGMSMFFSGRERLNN
jgi:hypothetical protein